MVRNYLNNHRDSDKEIYWDMVCTAMQSVSKLCVIPIQDYLCLGNEARMNAPSTLGDNCNFLFIIILISFSTLYHIREVTRIYGRLAKESVVSEEKETEKEKIKAETDTKAEKKGEA